LPQSRIFQGFSEHFHIETIVLPRVENVPHGGILILDKWNRAYAENIGFERFKRGN
jgi:hypothetical protein